MASADNPTTPAAAAPSAAVTPADDAAVKRLPPPRQPPSPESFDAPLRVIDWLLVAVVLAFAFLSALFPARNSDFFLHAATGRLIAHGQYRIGVDPFAFSTSGAEWVNANWLYDLIVYLIYAGVPFGGTVLIVLKALMVAALAEVMLRTAREPGRPRWIPVCCVGLAVLVLSPRVWLQPLCVSFFLLAVTYWLLHMPRRLRERADAAPARRPNLAYWLIPPLCLLWANLDGWFLLGPALVGLYLFGEMLQGWLGPADAAPAPGERRTLLFVLLASVVACLVNPHFYRVFASPSLLGLTDAADALRDDEWFKGMFVTPLDFQGPYFSPYSGMSVAGLAFFPLVLLGVVSFAAAQWVGRWRWECAVVWTAFLALAIWRATCIPFFAVVAGPIVSLNFLDFAARRFGVKAKPGSWALGGRLLTLAAGVVLLVAVWPGWLQALQPPPEHLRRVGWTVEPDPALQRLAEQIAQWRRDGIVDADARWFNLAPTVLPYLAWFAPGERGFIDNQRLALYNHDAAEDFTTMRASLGRIKGDAGAADPRWRSLLRRNDAHLLIWYDARPFPMSNSSALPTLLSAPKEWPLLFHDGAAAVFGWRDPGAGSKAESFAGLQRTPDQEAFGPDAAAAPPGPWPDLQPPDWWAALWTPEKPRPPDADEAAVEWVRFSVLQPPYVQRFDVAQRDTYRSAFAEAVLSLGAGGPWQGSLASLYAIEDADSRLADARQKMDLGPPAPLYLSVRAARRALAVNANDASTYRFLAHSYTLLEQQTRAGQREAAVAYPQANDPNRAAGDPRWLLVLRRVQIAAALRRALVLEPDNDVAELLAFQLYRDWAPPGEPGYLDLALDHGEKYLAILKARGASEKDTSDLDNQLKPYRKAVSERKDTYVLQSANRTAPEKVEIALKLSLAQEALDELLKIDWGTFDEKAKPRALQRELSLFVLTGRVDEVRKALADEQEKSLKDGLGVDPDVGLPAYEWLNLQVAAAEGDYAGADAWLQKLQDRTGRSIPPLLPVLGELGLIAPDAAGVAEPETHALTALLLGRLILGQAPVAAGAPCLPVPPLYNTPTVLGLTYSAVMEPLGRPADLEAARGWLALESGAVADARAHFEAAQKVAPSDRVVYRARGLTELGLEWLDAGSSEPRP